MAKLTVWIGDSVADGVYPGEKWTWAIVGGNLRVERKDKMVVRTYFGTYQVEEEST